MNPYYLGTPRTTIVQVTSGVTVLDGSGDLVACVTGVTNGTTLVGVYIKGTGTTTAGSVRLYIYDGSSTTRLIDEVLVTAITASGSTSAFAQLWIPPEPIMIHSGQILKAAPQNSETFNLITAVGDY